MLAIPLGLPVHGLLTLRLRLLSLMTRVKDEPALAVMTYHTSSLRSPTPTIAIT